MPAAIIGIIQGVLPTVATAVFMAQLPLFLTLLTKFEGISSHALIKYSVQNKFYWFSFVTVFLGTALSSGILPAINELKQNPGSVVSILGVAIPGSATFFINYILLLSLIGPALELLQIGSVAFKLLLPKISDMTPRALFLLNQVPDFDFGLRYSPVSMIFLFGLVFSTINPLVAVAAAFYFVVSYFVFGIQLLNVYKLSVDTGGQYYPRALFTILTGLIVAQLVNVCLLFLKKAYGPGGAMAAVCILTIGGSIHLYTDFIGRRKRMLNDLLVALHDKGDMNPPEWIGEDLDYIHPNLSTVPVNVWVAGDDVAARFEAELTMHKLPVTTSCPHLIKETGGSTSNIYRPVERPLTDMHHDQHRLVSATTLIV